MKLTSIELQRLLINSMRRSKELEAKYRSGAVMTRKDCDDLRHCTQRLGLIARELWILTGKTDDTEFDCLKEPIKLTPLPASMRPLDLSARDITGGIH